MSLSSACRGRAVKSPSKAQSIPQRDSARIREVPQPKDGRAICLQDIAKNEKSASPVRHNAGQSLFRYRTFKRLLEQISPNFSLLTGLAQLSEIVPMLCVGIRPQVLCVHDLTHKAGKSLAPTRSMGVISHD